MSGGRRACYSSASAPRRAARSAIPVLRGLLRALPLLVILAAGSGCVSVYQPLSGLQTPVMVDPQLANFADLRILVHCVPEDLLEGESGVLCDRMRTLFENQGATVQTVTSVTRTEDEETFPPPPAPEADAEAAKPEAGEGEEDELEAAPPRLPPDLIVELRARELHEKVHYTMWAFSWLTLTLAPGVSENAFVQEVVIRDARGTLLVTGALEGRIVRYFGFGYWATSKLLDLIARDDDEELTDDRLSELLCSDLYGQISQMVFNANMRRKVLGS